MSSSSRNRRRYSEFLIGTVIVFLSGCNGEFPNESNAQLDVQAESGFQDTLTVRDTSILRIRVTDSRGEVLTGIQVDWRSENSDILELKPVEPASPSRQDSLESRLATRVIAHARGAVLVSASIDRVGVDRAEFQATMVVRERWLSISAGASHTCAIASDSTAYCWGAGQTGALGNGLPIDTSVPSPVLTIGGIKFLSISAGEDNTCGVNVQTVTYCWGTGLNGRLGNADPSGRSQLTPSPISGGSTFRTVAAGRTSCGIANDFTAQCWGDDNLLQLGFQPLPLDQLDQCGSTACSLTPRAVSSTPNSYSLVDVGGVHTCALSRSTPGQAQCWGTGLRGALGAGPSVASTTPIPVLGGLSFGSISAGGEHTCGIVSGNQAIYCWGNNNHGQLGDNTPDDKDSPTPVTGSLAYGSVSAGRQHTCAIGTSGPAYCWGQDDHGQLGDGSSGDRQAPVPISGGLTFSSLSAGDSYTCGIAVGGAAYCWGGGAFGRLGNGSANDRSEPTRISEPN
ncbi:MAG: RCC1 domain-containing protein [Gemmatimonadales bacterium]